MEFFEKIVSKAEQFINPEQYRFEVKQMAQAELIQRAGCEDSPYRWIEVNSKTFDTLINDERFDYIKRLGDESTHDAALEEIEGKLIPLNTIH